MRLTRNKKLSKKKNKKSNEPPPMENIEETLRWYETQIAKSPKDTGLYYAKAALLAKEGRYEESIKTLDRIIELDPSNEKVWYIKANTLFHLKHYDEAITCFDRILEFAKNDERVWYHKGEALSKLKRYKEAIECYDKAIDLDRNYTEAWLGRGNAIRRLRSKDIDEDSKNMDEERRAELNDALENYSKASNIAPESEEAWQGKADVLYRLGRYEDALPCYDKCLQIFPNHVLGLYGKGKTLIRLKRKDEGMQLFEKAIGFTPDGVDNIDPEIWSAKANSFYELGRYEDALTCFDKVLEKYPDNRFALKGKGNMLKKLGRNEESLQCFKNAVELGSKPAEDYYRMGSSLNDSGDYDGALEFYNEAVLLDPKFEDAWFRIGELLQKKNDHEKALECFSWISKINPDNVKAKKAILTLSKKTKSLNDQSYNQNERKQKGLSNERINPVGGIKNEGIATHTNEVSGQLAILRQGEFKERVYSEFDDTKETENISQGSDESDSNEIFNAELNILLDELEQRMKPLCSHGSKSRQIGDCDVSIHDFLNKGKNHMEKKEYEDAMNFFNKVLELDPNNLDAWSAKGDVLMVMENIDEATKCYKKVMLSYLTPTSKEVNNAYTTLERKDNGAELLDNNISLSEYKNEKSNIIVFPGFECPNCGSIIDFNEKLCQECNQIFLEEEFHNSLGDVDDDLIFFDRLKEILKTQKPLFIHLDGTNGIIRYLEKRKNNTTGNLDYVLVKGVIEKISWDYSFK